MGDAPKTDRERRDMAVAIAKDVLERLAPDEGPALKMTQGHYAYGMLESPVDLDDDLRDRVDAVQAKCKVCMLGAAMLSKARLYDDIAIGRIMPYGDSRQIDAGRSATVLALVDYFDEETLDLLECAFEVRPTCGYTDIAPEVRIGGAAFGGAYADDAERARAIMERVVACDGGFDVEPLSSFNEWKATGGMIVDTSDSDCFDDYGYNSDDDCDDW